MPAPFPDLQGALALFLDRVDAEIKTGGYDGEPIRMFLAGGLAVNFHCGSRYTGDIDASFSRRLLLRDEELAWTYRKAAGSDALLHFDRNYNPALALLHPDHEANAVEWLGIGNERRAIQLRVLAPLDLALSKVARFSEQDRRDIRDLARVAGFDLAALRGHAAETLAYFLGDQRPILTALDLLESDLRPSPENSPETAPTKGALPPGSRKR